MEIEWKGDQARARDGLLPLFREKASGGTALLSGYAGTGKTRLVSTMLQQGDIKGKTVICAPTHKAVRVMHTNMNGTGCDFATIHSLLRIKPVFDEKGSRKFEPYGSPNKPLPIQGYENILLDEVSMLDDDLFKMVMDYRAHKSRVLFLGDSFQLQPVSHDAGLLAIPFREPLNWGIEVHKLEQIIRQGEGSPIIDFATSIRNQDIDMSIVNGGLVRQYGRPQLGQYALNVFRSDAYKQDTDTYRHLAWTNLCVDTFNKVVHERLYPKHEDSPIAVGESIILREAYTLPKKEGTPPQIFQNNEELKMLDRQDFTWDVEYEHENIELRFSSPAIRYTATNGQLTGKIIVIRDIHIASWNRFLDVLTKKIKYSKELMSKSLAWGKFWELKARVATWKHAYAQTIHTAQGSTFHTASIDMNDVRRCRGEEYWHLLYTGVTRPSNQLILV